MENRNCPKMLSAPITTKDLKVEVKGAVKAKMGGDSSPPKYHGPCCGGTRKAGEYGMFSCVVTGVKFWGCAKCRKPLPDDYEYRLEFAMLRIYDVANEARVARPRVARRNSKVRA